jgi:hypothetical protein
MPILSKDLRRILENTVADARQIAEEGAEQALKQLAVHHSEAWPAMTAEQKTLREKLRAHGKQLGDRRDGTRSQELHRLKQACAYEHWHRMLFARFLAENDLLIHPDYGQPLSLDEVRELAREQNTDWLFIAASFAQQMLLEVFRPDDPVLFLILPPETRQKLEEKLASLPTEVFTAEDSLGWVYQFWQRDEKDAVNRSEVKIGADELAPVTQLFTEDYMVLFLLHNTLGAWWTAKRQDEGKDFTLPGYEWSYLRLNEDGTPTVGKYSGWPKAARDLRLLDPSMGSGHFLAFALPIIARMRMAEEGLSLLDSISRVLSDNLFGLELDPRCSQIAAFNLALTAWRLAGQHFALPILNLACAGLGINANEDDWVRLAGADGRQQDWMRRMYTLFRQAPLLGSLIDPTRVGGPLFSKELADIWPFLEKAVSAERHSQDAVELAVCAQGLLAALKTLSSRFHLVATNVPYLGRGKHVDAICKFCDDFYADSKTDIATCFVERCRRFCAEGGTVAVVTKQEFLFQTSYRDLRRRLLRDCEWQFVARLGEHAFQSSAAAGAFVMLCGFTHSLPTPETSFFGWELGDLKGPSEKAQALLESSPKRLLQVDQIKNPESRIVMSAAGSGILMSARATSQQGIKTGDDPKLRRFFWEVPVLGTRWRPFQSTVEDHVLYGGREGVIDWQQEGRDCARLQGLAIVGKPGVIVSQMRDLPATLYSGDLFDSNVAPIVPNDSAHLPALWSFCSSDAFRIAIRALDPKVAAANATFTQVPFDLNYWQQVASELYPGGLPAPHSTDPTQWLFDGHPVSSDAPLHVAVCRLVGYRWPRQTGSAFPGCPPLHVDGLEGFADDDGIICLNALAGQSPGADRLRRVLAQAFGQEWSAARLSELVGPNGTIEDWLRDRFFQEHCDMFHQRPYVWHIWDGRKDGFHALVNYHRLASPNGIGKRTLEKLIYTYLGDWTTRQKAEVASGVDGADARLSAAQHLQTELEKILTGEPPYDIFVRWKAIQDQPIGWEPDLNDGVRCNIRPWLKSQLALHTKPKKDACVLRVTPKIAFSKDRGKETDADRTKFPWFAHSPERNNDIHLNLDEKRRARERKRT